MPIMHSPRAKEFLRILRQRLSDETVSHCIFTAEFMVSYATQTGITNEQAVTAGLLHDLCKEVADDDLLSMAGEYGIVPNEIQQARPMLLHGPVAAEECRRSLDVNDEAVYEAIYWHTTGRPGFGQLGLALYFADFSEPLRKRPEAAEARNRLREDGFRKALLFVADSRIEYLRKKSHVDPITEEFHAWLNTVTD